MRGKWTVQYKEYLQFEGVKEAIEEVKVKRKGRIRSEESYGQDVEDVLLNILSHSNDVTVNSSWPQMDVGFGADARVAYKENDKNYSFFLDITAAYKNEVEYFTLSGGLTPDANKAFSYETDYFTVRFGIKPRHASHFLYEKPVVVLHVSKYVPCTGISTSHLRNMVQVMISVHTLMMSMGYGARASQKITPNKKKYGIEYRRSLNKEEN